MAIEAKIARGYSWRMLIIAGVCLVLGVWGVYDYVVAIPRDQAMYDRLELMQMCKSALQTEQPRKQLTPEARKAYVAVVAELNRVLEQQFGEVDTSVEPAVVQEKIQRLTEALEASPDAEWIRLLTINLNGLIAERRLPLTQQDYPAGHQAFETATAAIEAIGEVTAPGKYDRVTQWAFILCLPFVPYYVVMYVLARRRVYRLDDDGTLHLPGDTWKPDEIADIDMSRWMAKSIAWPVHNDGRRVKLDDYKYRNLHLIIGAIASRLHPDEWDAEAKPIDSVEDEAAEEVAVGGESEAPAAQPEPAGRDA